MSLGERASTLIVDAHGPESGAPASARDELTERLITSAASVFAEKGYDGAGVQEIARRAGCTTGAIYGRFTGKAELLAEALRASCVGPLDRLLSAAHTEGGEAGLVAAAGVHLATREGHERQALLLEAFVAARRDPEVAAVMRALMTERRSMLGALVTEGKAHGAIVPDVDTEAVVHFCHTVALGFLLQEAIGTPKPDPTAWRDLVVRLVGAVGDTHGELPELDGI